MTINLRKQKPGIHSSLTAMDNPAPLNWIPYGELWEDAHPSLSYPTFFTEQNLNIYPAQDLHFPPEEILALEDFNFDSFNLEMEPQNQESMPERGERKEEQRRGERDPPHIRSRSSSISFEDISKFFYMPITEAAKAMRVGLTVLKKRCRELGISRWPHRKMKSLNSLIHNVQELGKGTEMEESVRREIETLEEHKRMLERMPEMQLTERTKKLRQACFKANFKKRRAGQLPSLTSTSSL